ncbi:hypothetical protein F0562_030849 [Nyssa sinensis]|uniref:Uncharacterized protein n=1 Tax=Nyssa sinensis TaxID=561372 RepID=A0A5J5B3Y8_9ASTE|nr:hypothetical protein F0562_030849 [Nyssa sinensis]
MKGNMGRMVSFNRSNWVTWKTKVKNLLYCKDLYGPNKGDKGKLEGTKDDEWKKLDRKSVGVIRQWIDDSVFHHVSTKNSPHALWTKLEGLYERKTAVNKAFLFQKLVNLKYKEWTPIAEHLNDIKSIVNKLATMKITFDDELQALLLFSSLSKSWEILVVTVSNLAPDGVVSMNQVTSSLLNEETRRKTSGFSQPDALVVENEEESRIELLTIVKNQETSQLQRKILCDTIVTRKDLMGKKVVRSRDVVFLKDQIAVDFEKVVQPEPHVGYLIDIDLNPPPIVHDDNEKEVQPVHEDGENDGIPNDVEVEDEGELPPQELPPQP